MADQTAYIFRAIGPVSLLKAVDPTSVTVMTGARVVDAQSGVLTIQDRFKTSVEKPIEWTQNYIGDYGPGIEEVASFGCYWQAYDATGIVGSGGISAVGKVLVIPQSVSCRVGSEASASYRAVVLDAAAVVGTTTQTPPVADDSFIIGPSEFNGSALANIISQNIDFGLTVEFNTQKSGAVYPTSYVIRTWNPVITIETEDLNVVKSYINGPSNITSDCCVVNFQGTSGNSGYGYTVGKGSVEGSIKGAVGTLTIRPLDAATIIAGATYSPA